MKKESGPEEINKERGCLAEAVQISSEETGVKEVLDFLDEGQA